MRQLSVAFVTLALAFAAGQSGSSQVPAGNRLRLQPGNAIDRYIVVLQDAGPTGPASRAPQIAREIAAAYRAQPQHVYTSVLNGFSAAMPRGVAEAVSRDPRVAYVEQVLPTRAHATQAPTPSWGLDRIDQRTVLNTAYQYSNGAAGVKVFVVDSGIRISHQEFGGRATYGQNFDRTSSGQPPEDCSGHGTHVAGTIGGSSVGVAKGATLISVRVWGCDNWGFSDDLIAAINYVTQHRLQFGGPSVANLSGGVGPIGWEFTALDDAVRQSIQTGVTWVVSAGNNNGWVFEQSPARVDEALTVAAATETDQRAYFSNFGPQVDYFAPGTNIYSAINFSNASYIHASGTSMAAPHVAGIAARLLEYQPWAPPLHVQNWTVEQATLDVVADSGPGTPNRYVYSKFIDEQIASAQP